MACYGVLGVALLELVDMREIGFRLAHQSSLLSIHPVLRRVAGRGTAARLALAHITRFGGGIQAERILVFCGRLKFRGNRAVDQAQFT